MLVKRRLVPGAAVVMAAGLLAGCGSAAERASVPVTSPPHGRTLVLEADGTIDPMRVDLSGTRGVNRPEQRRAENLLRGTIESIRRWSNVAQAKADGFVSIGDGFSGTEHYVHWDWIEDRQILEPARPESLVYRVEPGGRRTLEAAMYILPRKYRLDNTPDVGGPLTQFHIHDNLCFTSTSAPRFVRLTWDGTCHAPLVKQLVTPMLHVWIRPNRCGPFALVGGFVRGSIKAGEHALCDTAHGSAARS